MKIIEEKNKLHVFLKTLLDFPDRLSALRDAMKSRNSFPASIFIKYSSPLLDHNLYFSSHGDLKMGYEIHLLQARFNPNALNDLQIEISNIIYLVNRKDLFNFVNKTKRKFGKFLRKLSKDDRESIASLWFETVKFVEKSLQKNMGILIKDIQKFCISQKVNYSDTVEFIYYILSQTTYIEAYQKAVESIWCSSKHDNVRMIEDINHNFFYLRLGKNLLRNELEAFIKKYWKKSIRPSLKDLKERKYPHASEDNKYFARDCSIYELHLRGKRDCEIKDILLEKGKIESGRSTEYIRKIISNFSRRLK